jgi:TolB-like protein/Tfp pilus assembly protein PilF
MDRSARGADPESALKMSEIYRFGEFELDTARFQVRRRGEVLAVQPQVFDVLHYLVRHHDRVVSKDELLEQVWNGRYISETTLSSRIKAVRQLIGDSGKEQALLRTLRHRGFRFVGDVEVALTSTDRIVGAPAAESGVPDPAGRIGVAVLPFDTEAETGTADRRYVGEGIAADIISLLARHHWLKVISRGSSFAFRAGATPLRQIGAELGVRYLVTGRTRFRRGRIRIDAELADGSTETQLWSRSDDRDETDFFALQEEIAEQIAASIEPRLSELEQVRASAKQPSDLDAWDCVQRGFWHLYRFTADNLTTAESWFRRALDIEPGLARTHAARAYVALQLAFYGPVADRNRCLETARACASEAVALDPWDAFNRFVLGRALCLVLEFAEAEAELLAAIDLNPSFAQAWFALGFCYSNWDRAAEALPLFEKAAQLSPQDPHLWTFHHMRAMTHYRLDDLADAESYARAATRAQNATYWPFATLCSVLGNLERVDDAAAIADRLVKMRPGYSAGACREDFFFARDSAFIDRFVRGLATAGIPTG